MILQPTQKLQTWLKKGGQPLPQEADLMQCWHANIFKLERKNCLLFTHTPSRYSIVFYGITRHDLPTLYEHLRVRAAFHLWRDGFNEDEIERVLGQEGKAVPVYSTSSRHVLANMNQFKQTLGIMHWHGRLQDHDEATWWINTQNICTVHGFDPREYLYPAVILRALLRGGK